jgi:hypothetical protein
MDTIHMMASSFLGCLKVHSSNVERKILVFLVAVTNSGFHMVLWLEIA